MSSNKANAIKTICFFALIIVLTCIDQYIKIMVSSGMNLRESFVIIKGFFEITYVRNTGAAWGMFSGNTVLLGIVSSVTASLMFYIMHAAEKKLVKISLAFIVAGALGNVIDRFRLGYVIDYLNFYIFGYDFPVFNLADMCVTAGCILLFIYVIFCTKNDEAVLRSDTLLARLYDRVFKKRPGQETEPNKENEEHNES